LKGNRLLVSFPKIVCVLEGFRRATTKGRSPYMVVSFSRTPRILEGFRRATTKGRSPYMVVS